MYKYKFTSQSIYVGQKQLYRIIAMRDFADVKNGDIGGFVESTENLSQKGDCWIYDDARAYGHSLVSGNARLRDHAAICDHAIITDDAELRNDARASGDTFIWEHAVIERSTFLAGFASVGGRALLSCEPVSMLFDRPNITGCARISGDVQIHGHCYIDDDVEVHDRASISGCIKLTGNARLTDDVRIGGKVNVSGDARLMHWTQVSGNTTVTNFAQIAGHAEISGRSFITGKVVIASHSKVHNETISGDERRGVRILTDDSLQGLSHSDMNFMSSVIALSEEVGIA